MDETPGLLLLLPFALGWLWWPCAVVLAFCETGPSPRRSAQAMREAAGAGATLGGLFGVGIAALLWDPSPWEWVKTISFVVVSGTGWFALLGGLFYWMEETKRAKLG